MGSKIDLTGTKYLIAAGALAGTIGGWLFFSLTGGANSSTGGSAQDSTILNLLSQPISTLAQPGVFSSEAVDSITLQPTAQPPLRNAPPPAAITQSSK